jgi:hypothetical protein
VVKETEATILYTSVFEFSVFVFYKHLWHKEQVEQVINLHKHSSLNTFGRMSKTPEPCGCILLPLFAQPRTYIQDRACGQPFRRKSVLYVCVSVYLICVSTLLELVGVLAPITFGSHQRPVDLMLWCSD